MQIRLQAVMDEKVSWEKNREEAYQEEIQILKSNHKIQCQALQSKIDHLEALLQKIQSKNILNSKSDEEDAILIDQSNIPSTQGTPQQEEMDCSKDKDGTIVCTEEDEGAKDAEMEENNIQADTMSPPGECNDASPPSPKEVPLPYPTVEKLEEPQKELVQTELEVKAEQTDVSTDGGDTGMTSSKIESMEEEMEIEVQAEERKDEAIVSDTNTTKDVVKVKHTLPISSAQEPIKNRQSKRRKTRSSTVKKTSNASMAEEKEKESVSNSPTVKISKFYVKEIKECRKALRDLDPDWTKRSNAILKLEKLVKEDRIMQMDGWNHQAEKLREPLSIQLTDLRSSIIKQMCSLLSSMAESAANKFDDLFVYLFPSLQKLLYASIKVKTIINNCAHGIVNVL